VVVHQARARHVAAGVDLGLDLDFHPSSAAVPGPDQARAAGRVMDDALFRWHKDVPSKNPGPGTDPARSVGREDEACFLLLTFLCTSKEK
jgi:hypothetical protein